MMYPLNQVNVKNIVLPSFVNIVPLGVGGRGNFDPKLFWAKGTFWCLT